MIKGHTKIELTNVRTGERQVVEDDNLVTNALNMYFRQSPNIADIMKPISNPLVDTYFGGLLLFQDPIEEKHDNYNLPNGNTMIGNAVVNYSTAGSYPEFGSYNSEESSFSIENGAVTRKYVYDFGTSRGNGTISAVCLTNLFAGFVGAGNKSCVSNRDTANGVVFSRDGFWQNSRAGYGIATNEHIYANDISTPSSKPYYIFSIDMENNCVYWIADYDFVKTGKLTLYKSHFPFSKINPTVPLFDKNTIYEMVQIDVPDELTTAFSGKTAYTFMLKSNGCTYFIVHSSSTIAVSNSFYLWKIATDCATTELFTLVNASDVALRIESGAYAKSCFTVCNGYLLYYYDSQKIIKIKIADPTDVAEIALNLDKLAQYDAASNAAPKYMLVCKNNVFLCVSHRSVGIIFRIDTENNTSVPMNGLCPFASMSSYMSLLTFGENDFFIELMDSGYTPYSSYGCYRNPFTLSTINNLPEPVTKTSDMTMKITYTLTSKIEPDEV